MPDQTPTVPPVGLATKLGLVVTTVLGAAGTITLFLNGDHTPETLGALAGVVATVVAIILGRSSQAAAIYGARAATGQDLEQPSDGR